eukprot:scaffold107028_cov36-Attheya_sp.AAC.3
MQGQWNFCESKCHDCRPRRVCCSVWPLWRGMPIHIDMKMLPCCNCSMLSSRAKKKAAHQYPSFMAILTLSPAALP